MKFLESIFGWHVGKFETDGNHFTHIFSIWHILVLILIAVSIFFVCYFVKKKSTPTQNKTLKTIGWVLLALEIFRIVYRTISSICYNKYLPDANNMYDWAEIISFAFCTMITFFIIVTLLIDKPKWNKFAYEVIFVNALLGGLSALIYPDMLNTYYPIYHIINLQTLVTHTLLVIVPILLISTKKLYPQIKNCWKPAITMFCFAMIARILSLISDNSFMYMNGFELLPGFEDKPLYAYIWILIIAYTIFMVLCYLPTIIIDAIKKHKQGVIMETNTEIKQTENLSIKEISEIEKNKANEIANNFKAQK